MPRVIGGGVFLDALDGAGDHGERLVVVGDEERFADEEIEFAGAELVLLAEGDRVHHEVEIVLVVLDLRIAAHRHGVLDGQRMEGEDFLQDGLALLGRGLGQIDPDQQALVGPDEAQGVGVEVAADQFTIVKDKGVNHKKRGFRR